MPRSLRIIALACVFLLSFTSSLYAAKGACKAEHLTLTIDLARNNVNSVVIGPADGSAVRAVEQAWNEVQERVDSVRESSSALNGAKAELHRAKQGQESPSDHLEGKITRLGQDLKDAQREAATAVSSFGVHWARLHDRTEQCGGRWITNPKQSHRLTVLVHAKPGNQLVEIKIAEKQRRTHLADDIVTLLQLVPSLETKGDMPRPRFAKRVYDLAEVRANLDVVIQEQGAGTKSKELAKQSFVTGPPEHWSLSANAVLTKVEETKVTDEGTLQLEDSPYKFLFGLDYTLGDLLSESPSFTDGLGFKFMVEASSRPGDRLGLALTYRGGAGPLSFHLVSPYVGALWTRSEVLDEEGNVVSRGDLEGPDFVVGLSFNLDRAVEWLKPKKEGS